MCIKGGRKNRGPISQCALPVSYSPQKEMKGKKKNGMRIGRCLWGRGKRRRNHINQKMETIVTIFKKRSCVHPGGRKETRGEHHLVGDGNCTSGGRKGGGGKGGRGR